jgi:O-antigen/teichoic acid export membrane protein
VIYSVATFGTVFILSGLLGASDLGGLRAAQSIFAPLSLILPAIALPGLPAMARALRASSGSAIRLAAALSGLVGALAALYVGAMVLLGGRLIPFVFGSSFAGFANLAAPIGTWQLVSALAAGFGIFLIAQQRGRDLVVIRATGAVASTASITLLAWTSGVVGAAWGFAVGGGFVTVLTVVLALRCHGRSTREDTRRSAEKSGGR